MYSNYPKMASGLSVVSGSVGESSVESRAQQSFNKKTRNPAVHYNSALSQY